MLVSTRVTSWRNHYYKKFSILDVHIGRGTYSTMNPTNSSTEMMNSERTTNSFFRCTHPPLDGYKLISQPTKISVCIKVWDFEIMIFKTKSHSQMENAVQIVKANRFLLLPVIPSNRRGKRYQSTSRVCIKKSQGVCLCNQCLSDRNLVKPIPSCEEIPLSCSLYVYSYSISYIYSMYM